MKKKLTPADVGALSELKACQYLMENGLEVFRNVSPNGHIDLISLNPITMEFLTYDVKSGVVYQRIDGKSYYCNKLKPYQVEKGIKRIAVYPDFIIVDDGTASNHNSE